MDHHRGAAGGIAKLLNRVGHHFVGGAPEDQANVLGKQDYGLAAWKTPHGIHHESQRPECSNSQGLFAEMVERSGAAHAAAQWREATHPDATLAILHAIERRVQQALIGGELLQRSHAGAGADNGHQVARTHLFVDEIPDCVADGGNVFAGQSQVIHHEREGAAHFSGPQHRWRRGRFAFHWLGNYGSMGCSVRRWFRRHVRELRNGLRLAVLQDLEGRGRQVRYTPASGIGHDGVHLNQVDIDSYYGVRYCPRHGAGLRCGILCKCYGQCRKERRQSHGCPLLQRFFDCARHAGRFGLNRGLEP